MPNWGLGNTIFEIALKVHFVVNFRLGTYNVPEGPSANPYGEARSSEFDGTDGWDRSDGPEKCPLKFFILCGYIDYVYSYLCTE